jgi:AAA+ ATPase superfamily predicted ATPase
MTFPTPSFIDREQELAALNRQIAGSSSRRGSAFIMLYGKRRVGKSTLLKEWARSSGLSHTYWVADKDLAEVQRRRFFAGFLNTPLDLSPRFDSWAGVFEQVARVIGDKRHILILDEVPYAAASDRNFYAALQHAWDQHFLNSHVILVICGSHVRAMDELFEESSPLYGRFTLPIYLEPMSFAQMRKFFPKWSAEERVAAYAMVGGTPEYYEWLEPEMSLLENLRTRVIQKPSPFLVEDRFLLYDQLEQPAAHLSVIRAIGEGKHSFDEIRLYSEGTPTKLSSYLDRLRKLRLIERSVSALVRPNKRKDTKDSRWVLTDPFLRFYYRFIAPVLNADTYDPAELTSLIWPQMRGFVGKTAFEEICREWVRQASLKPGRLPFQPTTIGSHWSRDVEADVIAINWETKHILIGECKWDEDPVSREQVRKLIEHTMPKTMANLARQLANPLVEINEWQSHLATFARRGFTPEARKLMKEQNVMGVDLKQIDTEIV